MKASLGHTQMISRYLNHKASHSPVASEESPKARLSTQRGIEAPDATNGLCSWNLRMLGRPRSIQPEAQHANAAERKRAWHVSGHS